MKLRYWTAKEDAWIKKHYPSAPSVEAMAARLGTKVHTVRKRAFDMGVVRDPEMKSKLLSAKLSGKPKTHKVIGNQYGYSKRWSTEEDTCLKKNYPDAESTTALAKQLNRGVCAVSTRAVRILGLSRNDEAYKRGMSKSLMEKNKGRKRPDLGAWCKAHPMFGKKNHFYGRHHTEEVRTKLSAHQKKVGTFKWLSKNEEFQKSRMKALHASPNKSESILDAIIQKACPKEYRFVGDGAFILDGLNPDWVNVNGQKKIIELFGDAFHKPGMAKRRVGWRQTETGRKRAFIKFGYKTLVIWASEIYSLIRSDKFHPRLLNKIRRFTCA